MSQESRLFGQRRVAVIVAVLVAACVSKEKTIEARANGLRAGLSGSKAHFAYEAEAICGELPNAETPFVPPLDKECSRGCRCASGSDASADPRTIYDCSGWNAREWQLIRYTGMYSLDGKPNRTVYFHHKARWHRTAEGCRLEFTVHGDLDGDGVHSTYVTWTEATPDGALGHWPDESLLLE